MSSALRTKIIRYAASLPPGQDRLALVNIITGSLRGYVVHLSPDWYDLKYYHGPVDDVVLWIVEQVLASHGLKVKQESSGYHDGNLPPEALPQRLERQWDGAIDAAMAAVDDYHNIASHLREWRPQFQREWCVAAFDGRAGGQGLVPRPTTWHDKQWAALDPAERGLLVKAELADMRGMPTAVAVSRGAFFRS